jgi:hypothetical protein
MKIPTGGVDTPSVSDNDYGLSGGQEASVMNKDDL